MRLSSRPGSTTRPETGYGYIVPGEAIEGDLRLVSQFREKPDRATAERLIAAGGLWNSGLFAWTATRFLAEVAAVAPELSGAMPCLDRNDAEGFFDAVTPIAVDHAVFERSARVLTLPGDFGWDDVGAWDALARLRERDAQGNVLVGPVVSQESSNVIAWSDGIPIVLAGVRDLVVIHANGRLLVMDRSRAADLKRTLDRLPPDVRELP
jgi:mannose-1-phosphate guanylyltransferase